jgi:hypothetical protein
VSGQATAAARAGRISGAAAPARPLITPPRPRRVSGPARRGVSDRPVRRRSPEPAGIARGLLAALDGVSRRRALGGRTWIGLVAFALIGIVTLQLGLLKLNAGIGRALEHEAVLQRENAALSIENSEIGTSARITSWAARRGMEPVPMGALRFLAVRPQIDARRGAAALSATAHASPRASPEALGAATSAASGSSSSAAAEQSAAPVSSSIEPSSTGSGSTAGESAAAASAPTSSSGESSARASEGPAASPEASTRTPATGSPVSEAAPSGVTEGAPGGGTRASPSG